MTQNLKNKTVVVIGGSSGIGLSVAHQAFTQGARIMLTSRSLSKAIETAASIDAAVKGAALDVDDERSIFAFFDNIDHIDHIYIAAGGTSLGVLTDGSLDQHLTGLHTRIHGSLRIVRAAVHKILPGGSITFTGGISTDRPIAGAWVSGLGTATAEQLARVLVMEFPQIRFNAVSPGYTDTPLWDNVLGDNKAAVLTSVAAKLPTGRIATADEVAAGVIFLMSNGAVNGEVLHIDGGGRLI
jgi:NAD(P)-dependent dehydrogenase (short-subunit alcohol dehydrogenase family)